MDFTPSGLLLQLLLLHQGVPTAPEGLPELAEHTGVLRAAPKGQDRFAPHAGGATQQGSRAQGQQSSEINWLRLPGKRETTYKQPWEEREGGF